MKYKINKKGDYKIVSKTMTKPRYIPMFHDFFTSLKLMSHTEVKTFLAFIYVANENVVEMTKSKVRVLRNLTGVSENTLRVNMRTLVEKGFLVKGRDITGHILQAVYVVNPYMSCYRPDMAFTIKNGMYEEEFDGICQGMVRDLHKLNGGSAIEGYKIALGDKDELEEDFE